MPSKANTDFGPTHCRAWSTPKDCIMTVLGFMYLFIALPPCACVVGASVAWHFIDPITIRVLKLWNKITEPMLRTFVREEASDAFICNFAFLQGVIIPAMFFYTFAHSVSTGEISWTFAFFYHLIRIGPYFSNFAYAYTLCHKEGHQKGLGMFKKPYSYVLGNWWNWWIALFYGVIPSTFAIGHTINHHQYNNAEMDTVTTWDRPRDNFLNYVGYLPRWLGYSFNLTVIPQFMSENKYNHVYKMIYGSMFYFGWLFLIGKYTSALFVVAFLLYPLMESALLLSAINWSWHCFLDPDTENVYASSVTIFGGKEETNIMNEDFHVVHHQYPGAHWTKHPSLYEKHKSEYAKNMATCFNDTHAMEIFFLAILKEYDVLAQKFVDLSGKLSHEEKKALIVKRLRTCEWGSLENKLK